MFCSVLSRAIGASMREIDRCLWVCCSPTCVMRAESRSGLVWSGRWSFLSRSDWASGCCCCCLALWQLQAPQLGSAAAA